jgi:hypothetical protein
VDKYGNYSDLSPVSNTVTAASDVQIDYTGVPVPTQSKVTRKQILRNTAGQFATFYVDVDTTNVNTTSFSSTNTDAMLADQEAQPLFDLEGNDIANVYGVPPDWKPLLAYHLTRMWAAGEVTYSEGSCKVTTGSPTVTGFGTNWKSEYAGRYLHVLGATQSYLIDSVNETSQTITLDENYANASDLFAGYSIKAAPAERPLVYFSEAGLPEAWPAVNALSLPEDGDVVTGLMPMGSWLYVPEAPPRLPHHRPGQPGERRLHLQGGRPRLLQQPLLGHRRRDGVPARRGRHPLVRRRGPDQHLDPDLDAVPERAAPAAGQLVGQADVPRRLVSGARDHPLVRLPLRRLPPPPRHLLRLPAAGVVDRGGAVAVRLIDPRPHRAPHRRLGRRRRAGLHRRPRVRRAGPRRIAARRPGRRLRRQPRPSHERRHRGDDRRQRELPGSGRLSGGYRRREGGRPGPGYRLQRRHDAAPRPPVGRQAGRDVHVPDRRHPYQYLSSRLRMAPSENRSVTKAEIMFEPNVGFTYFRSYLDFLPADRAGYTYRGVFISAAKKDDAKQINLANDNGVVEASFDRHREGSTNGGRFVRIELSGVSGEQPVRFGEMMLSGVV